MFDPRRPYNDLPDLPPNFNWDTPAIFRKLVSASRSLASLSSSRALPNQTVLLNTVFLREAKESSEIENIVTTSDELFRAMAESEAGVTGESKEVLRYVEAMWHGMELIRTKPFVTNDFVRIVQTIKQNQAGVRKHTGTKIRNEKTGEVIYTPPEGEELIRSKLKNLEEFLNAHTDIDPLIAMAIAHYQFEAIHPFGDGNGRTGRIMNILYLVKSGLLKSPILYLSKYIFEHKDEYYQRLREVTEDAKWEEWILYMLDAVEETAIFTQRKIEDIFAVMDEVKSLMRDGGKYSKDLLDVLFQQPYCKAKFIVDSGIVKEQTARKYLEDLADFGIVDKVKIGRENLFINKKFLTVLGQD